MRYIVFHSCMVELTVMHFNLHAFPLSLWCSFVSFSIILTVFNASHNLRSWRILDGTRHTRHTKYVSFICMCIFNCMCVRECLLLFHSSSALCFIPLLLCSLFHSSSPLLSVSFLFSSALCFTCTVYTIHRLCHNHIPSCPSVVNESVSSCLVSSCLSSPVLTNAHWLMHHLVRMHMSLLVLSMSPISALPLFSLSLRFSSLVSFFHRSSYCVFMLSSFFLLLATFITSPFSPPSTNPNPNRITLHY